MSTPYVVKAQGAIRPREIELLSGAGTFAPGGLRFRSEMPVVSASLFSSGVAWTAIDFSLAASVMMTVFWRLNRSETAVSSHHLMVPMMGLSVLSASFVVILCHCFGLYATGANQVSARALSRLVLSIVTTVLVDCGAQSLSGGHLATNSHLMISAAAAGAVTIFARLSWHRYRADAARNAEFHVKTALIVGNGETARSVRDYLSGLPHDRYAFKGVLPLPGDTADEDVVGTLEETMSVARSMFVDEVIFSRRPEIPGLLSELLRQAKEMGIDVRIIPTVTETLLNRKDVQYIGDLPTIAVLQHGHHTLSRLAKRAIDIAGATIAMIMLAPVFAVIAIAIKCYSPGPVLYASNRVGYKGRIFTCFKFRTMVVNADAMRASLAHLNERSGVLFKISNDPRVTRIGAILRKYSLDELPQLWNVLRGDMSLVGPRPSISSEVAQYQPVHLRRLDVVPGITGLWQVEARRDASFDSYIRHDSHYIKHWSLWLDIKILLRTINAVVTGTGS